MLTCADSLGLVPRRVIAFLADIAAAVADFYYRLFDMAVALVLFLLITLLTLLPLHEAQSLLLFNANFAQFIQRGMHTRDFLASLWA